MVHTATANTVRFAVTLLPMGGRGDDGEIRHLLLVNPSHEQQETKFTRRGRSLVETRSD